MRKKKKKWKEVTTKILLSVWFNFQNLGSFSKANPNILTLTCTKLKRTKQSVERRRERERLDIFLSFGEHEVALQPRFAAGHLYNFPRRDNEDYAVVIIIVGGNQAVDRIRHGEKVVAAVYCQASGLLERPELLDNRPRPTVVCRCGCVTSLLCEW